MPSGKYIIKTSKLAHLDSNHPELLAVRHELGAWQIRSGANKAATKPLKRLLKRRRAVFGKDSSEALLTAVELARARGESGRVGEAYRSLLSIWEKVEASPQIGVVKRLDLGRELANWEGLWEGPGRANARLTDLLDRAEKSGLDSGARVFQLLRRDAARWQAVLIWEECELEPSVKRTRLGKAIKKMQKAEKELTNQLGVCDPETLIARGNLAGWYGNAGRYDAAIRTLEDLVNGIENVEQDHPELLSSKFELARWKFEKARLAGEPWKEPLAAMADRLQALEVGLGSTHPRYLRSAMALGNRELDLVEDLGEAALDSPERQGSARLRELEPVFKTVFQKGHPELRHLRDSLGRGPHQ